MQRLDLGVGGSGSCGVPQVLIEALLAQGADRLEAVSLQADHLGTSPLTWKLDTGVRWTP